MGSRSILESFNSSIEGLVYILKTQKNIRIHFLMAAMILVISFFLRLSKLDVIIIVAVITLVIVTEMISVALRESIGLINNTHRHSAHIIKNIADSTVLISILLALFIACLIGINFLNSGSGAAEQVVVKVKAFPGHATFISFIVVTFTVILVKVRFTYLEKFSLRGGMPSLHCAWAGSAWVSLSLITSGVIVPILAFVLLFLIARNRVQIGVHSRREVIIGTFLGAIITLLIFQLLGLD